MKKKNLVDLLHTRILICQIIITLSVLLTLINVSRNHQKVNQSKTNAFVYFKGGASVHVFQKK